MFVNTMDKFGDEATMNMIINGTITEYCDDTAQAIASCAFYGRNSLTIVDVPNVTTVGPNAFQECNNLVDVNMPNVTEIGARAFCSCPSLVEVCLPSLIAFVGNNPGQTFENCKALKLVDLPVCLHMPVYDTFTNCSALVAVVLRNTTKVCTLGFTGSFSNTPIAAGSGYIYVPGVLIDSYKAATNWSTYATQFRALEDYTVDGTLTGELDETKI